VSGASSAERTLPVEVDADLIARLQEDVKDEYVIERELGRGGMAAVFLATDIHLGRKVAVKLLPPELTFGAGAVERFKREARTAATLDHPHIIPIYRVSTGGKLFWYSMKYLQGDTLAQTIERRGALTTRETVAILSQVAEALDYAHRHSVIHRDVKPSNISVDESNWVTVTDFGIAKALDTKSLTGSGAMIGTPYYMSPEQCSGRRVTAASDQYALAVVAYQMLSGHLPFTGETVVDIIKKHCMDPPPPLAVLRQDLPRSIAETVQRALSKSPEDRFSSVIEFASALADSSATPTLQAKRPVTEPPKRGRPSATAGVGPPVKAPVTSPPHARRPRRAAIALVTLAVLGAAAVALYWHPWRAAHQSIQSPMARADSTSELQRTASPAPPQSPPSDSTKDSTSARKLREIPVPAASATLRLRGVPRQATVAVDGRLVRGSRLTLASGASHVVRVSAAGFESWADTLTPTPGATLLRTVHLRPELGPPVSSQTPTAPAPQQVQDESSGSSGPVQTRLVPAPVAYITLGSRPLSAISINGKPMAVNPVVNYELPAGMVRIHFVVTDSAGVAWSHDTTVTLASGEHRNLHYVQLARKP